MKREMPVSFAVCARYSVKRRLFSAVNKGGTTEVLRPLMRMRGLFIFIVNEKRELQ